jgi:hypothetical protein
MRSIGVEAKMPISMNAYWAGAGTVVLALAAGFGGGTMIADLISNGTAIPAPGTSRLERVMAEKPPKLVEHSGATGNVLAEAVPIAPDARPGARPENSEGRSALAPDPVFASLAKPEATVAQALQNSALDAIASSGPGQPAVTQKRQRSTESRVRQSRRKEARSRVADRKLASPDIIRRGNDGNIGYVIHAPGGQKVSAAEIETLKQRLREQRGRHAESTMRADALSYQPERRRALEGLFD